MMNSPDVESSIDVIGHMSWPLICLVLYWLLTYFIPQLLFTNLHIHFNTITYTQKGKRVELQVLKLIYCSPNFCNMWCVRFTHIYIQWNIEVNYDLAWKSISKITYIYLRINNSWTFCTERRLDEDLRLERSTV